MKKLFVIALAFLATTTAALAQKDTTAPAKKVVPMPPPPPAANPAPGKKDWSKVILSKRRSNDHFMFQLGYAGWAGVPDTIHINGFSRSANFYFMFDFPFKTDPRFSV